MAVFSVSAEQNGADFLICNEPFVPPPDPLFSEILPDTGSFQLCQMNTTDIPIKQETEDEASEKQEQDLLFQVCKETLQSEMHLQSNLDSYITKNSSQYSSLLMEDIKDIPCETKSTGNIMLSNARIEDICSKEITKNGHSFIFQVNNSTSNIVKKEHSICDINSFDVQQSFIKKENVSSLVDVNQNSLFVPSQNQKLIEKPTLRESHMVRSTTANQQPIIILPQSLKNCKVVKVIGSVKAPVSKSCNKPLILKSAKSSLAVTVPSSEKTESLTSKPNVNEGNTNNGNTITQPKKKKVPTATLR